MKNITGTFNNNFNVKWRKVKKSSPAGNRTPVSRVTGGDTHHYTNEDTVAHHPSSAGHLCVTNAR